MSQAHDEPEQQPGPDPDTNADPDAEPEAEPEEKPAAASRRRRRRPSGPRRAGTAVLAVLAAVGLGAACWSVPAVRTELRQSFTEQDKVYAELFFTTLPTFEGATVVVPVAVTDHGEGAKGYQLAVTLESPSGQAVDSTTVKIAARYGAPVVTVVKLQAKSEVAMVRVALVGHPQTLHYRFGKQLLPDH
ncbi:hypothetical protein [Kitasatospora sp. McL0602]|uniref:hypothetical protein n=1 Tax=Kitasatospora sp. McL0602 TaxID=3439530 RepID=UPI003F88999A